MHHSKAELDAVGNAIALLVRKCEDYHARMEANAPPEDPDAKKRAKDELDHAKAIEKAFAGEEEKRARAEAALAKAADKAEVAAEKKADHAAHPHHK